jgi:hypothetical protein
MLGYSVGVPSDESGLGRGIRWAALTEIGPTSGLTSLRIQVDSVAKNGPSRICTHMGSGLSISRLTGGRLEGVIPPGFPSCKLRILRSERTRW